MVNPTAPDAAALKGLDDAALVAACVSGRREAFDVIVERHRRTVYQVCYRFVSNHEDASDLSQEAFVRAWRGLKNFKGQSALSTWLYRIAVNVCLNKVSATTPPTEPVESLERFEDTRTKSARSLLLREERAAAVQKAIAGLPMPGLGNGEMSPAEIQKLFDAYLVMEAQQALALTDQQYPPFLARLRTLQDTRRRNQQERIQLMGQLQRLTNPRAATRGDEAAIKERLTALQELESRNAAEMRKAYAALDEVLEVRQQARFRVFEEQIERRKIELLMRARQQNRPQNQQPLRRPNQPPPPGV